MRNFHNIESLKPLSLARTFPYVGFAASGTKYYATRPRVNNGMWRFALAFTSHPDEPGYFYARTLAEASAKLETIGSN